MPYKDKEQQRKAVREAVERHRQGITSNTVDKRVLHLADALITPAKRAKLLLISKALDRTMTGLDGKPLRLGGLVRFGVSGFTFNEIKELL